MTLNIVSSFNGVSDPDAAAYIEAVEAADGELLEFAVGKAINDFVLGCKADGIWDAIKASCILAGARTLDGALVPLVGVAPTNIDFTSGDYDRKAGLAGNGQKSLLANYSLPASTYLSTHLSVHATSALPVNGSPYILIGAYNNTNNQVIEIQRSTSNVLIGASRGSYQTTSLAHAIGFTGHARLNATTTQIRASGTTLQGNLSVLSGPLDTSLRIFARNNTNSDYALFRSPVTLAFYSIGESLDLARLDTRVTDLITAFGAAIP